MSLLRDARLRAFHTVAIKKSFTGAARHLLLTQQAISFQIKSLEDEVGARIFRRDGKRIELTDLGTRLFDHADRILALYAEAEASMAEVTADLRGRLRVSSTNSLAKYVLPRAIGNLRSQYPDLKVTMEVGNSDYTLHCLREALADVAFVSDGPAQLDNYRVDPLFSDRIEIIVPSDHVWAARPSVSFEEFSKAALILREEGSGTRSLIERAITGLGATMDSLDTVLILGSAEAVKGAVQAGAGIGFVSHLSMRKELADGSLARIRVDGFAPRREFGIVQPSNRDVHRRVARFIELVRDAVPPALDGD